MAATLSERSMKCSDLAEILHNWSLDRLWVADVAKFNIFIFMFNIFIFIFNLLYFCSIFLYLYSIFFYLYSIFSYFSSICYIYIQYFQIFVRSPIFYSIFHFFIQCLNFYSMFIFIFNNFIFSFNKFSAKVEWIFFSAENHVTTFCDFLYWSRDIIRHFSYKIWTKKALLFVSSENLML